MAPLRLVFCCFALCACSTPPPPPPGPLQVTIPRSPDLRVTVRPPEDANYDPKALGASKTSIAIRVTNRGTRPAEVKGLRARFAATRDGVAFPCGLLARPTARVHEPESLDPGGSFVFERDLDCSLPLPGVYDVTLFMDVGKPKNTPVGGDPVAAFKFSLDDRQQTLLPRAYSKHKGLYALLTGERVTRPLTREAVSRGDYQVVIAVINAGSRPLHLGRAKLSLSVFRHPPRGGGNSGRELPPDERGPSFPCSSGEEPIDLPEELTAGSVHIAQAPLSCAPSQDGEYEVVGRLSIDGEPKEVGRLGLIVADNPIVFLPIPLRGFGTDTPPVQ